MNNVTWQAERHLFKFGGDIRKNLVDDVGQVAPTGNYRWVNLEELLLDVPPTQVGQRGLGATTRVLDSLFGEWLHPGRVQTRPIALPLNLGFDTSSIRSPRDLATQEEQAIGTVPGVIEFRKPRVEKDNWRAARRLRLGRVRQWPHRRSRRLWARVQHDLRRFRRRRPASSRSAAGVLHDLPAQLSDSRAVRELPRARRHSESARCRSRLLNARARLPTSVRRPTRSARACTRSVSERSTRCCPAGSGSVRYLHTEGRKLSVQAQLNAGIVPPASAFVPTWFSRVRGAQPRRRATRCRP